MLCCVCTCAIVPVPWLGSRWPRSAVGSWHGTAAAPYTHAPTPTRTHTQTEREAPRVRQDKTRQGPGGEGRWRPVHTVGGLRGIGERCLFQALCVPLCVYLLCLVVCGGGLVFGLVGVAELLLQEPALLLQHPLTPVLTSVKYRGKNSALLFSCMVGWGVWYVSVAVCVSGKVRWSVCCAYRSHSFLSLSCSSARS